MKVEVLQLRTAPPLPLVCTKTVHLQSAADLQPGVISMFYKSFSECVLIKCIIRRCAPINLLLVIKREIADVQFTVGVVLSSWDPHDIAVGVEVHSELVFHQRRVVDVSGTELEST